MAPRSSRLVVRGADSGDRDWMLERLRDRWGQSATIVVAGRRHDLGKLPAFVALLERDPAGIATYQIKAVECELVTLDAFVEGRGVGSALLEAVAARARRHRCRRLWLVTTNDSLSALRFYQRRGLRLVALRRDAVAEARTLKPEIPAMGDEGIPIRDEIELELALR
jgi:GNAT superfamily N-acetyltransferase